ncbi:hypothetical protein [Thermococcus sp.]
MDIAFLIPPLVSMTVGLYMALSIGQGVEIVAIAMGLTVAIILDVMAIGMRIYEEGISIIGYLSFMVRKTVKLDEIEWFAVRDGWLSCNAKLHFTLPAKACVYLKRRKGLDVSFSTTKPEEVKEVLTSLGVPRGA